MSFNELKDIIRSDYYRLVNKRQCFSPDYKTGKLSFVLEYFKDESLNFTVWFRLVSFLQLSLYSCNNKCIKLFLRVLYLIGRIIYTRKQRLYGIQLLIGTKVGKGLRFEHYGGIVIAGCVVIGSNCTILQDVTIGRNFNKDNAVPVIGDNCLLFAGAKIIGEVVVGNNVVVGCNSVVISSVPDGATVAGVPAKVISTSKQSVNGCWRKMFSLDS